MAMLQQQTQALAQAQAILNSAKATQTNIQQPTTTPPLHDPTTMILRHLVKGRIDEASEVWIKHDKLGLFGRKQKIEIGQFVDVQVDSSLREVLFPGLPCTKNPRPDGGGEATGVGAGENGC